MSLTHLKYREMQASIVSSLFRGFSEAMGHDKAIEIVKNVIYEDAIAAGKKLAREFSGNAMAELFKIVGEVWAKDDTLRMHVIKNTDDELFFDVTYCGYAEMYERMGIKELGCILSCYRDFPFLQGFNPEINLRRTKTIMEGASYCDFRYERKTPTRNSLAL
jgi:hypothetical protein